MLWHATGVTSCETHNKMMKNLTEDLNRIELCKERSTRITDHYFDILKNKEKTSNVPKRKLLQDHILENPEDGDRIGLPIYEVPPDVHHMGARRNIGDLTNADLFDEIIHLHNINVINRNILDFGCSSGRLTRVLANYFADTSVYGCDPRSKSIDWTLSNIDNANFFVNSVRPPLDNIQDNFFVAVIAISIWSHFSAERAISWFEEMHRVISPDGVLIFTVGGSAKLQSFYDSGRINEKKLINQRRRLDRGEYLFTPTKSDSAISGEFDVSHWGSTTADAGWYHANIGNSWNFLEHLPGRLLGVQDVYVIQPK